MRILLLLAVFPLWAVDDADAILKRWIAAQQQNDERARQYTYMQATDWYTYDNDGRPVRDRSETCEVIFVEGFEYQKVVTRDGKPLDAKEKARVEKEMRQTATERRRHRRILAPGGQIYFGNQSVDLGSREEVLRLFENRVVGEDEIRGHKTWVIESVSKKGFVPTNRHETEVTSFQKKFWIEEEQNVLVKQVYTVTGDRFFAKPGSTLTFEYDKVGPDTWHEFLLILDVFRVRDKQFMPSGRTEYRMSHFQKFDVQSSITIDIPK